MVSEVLSVLRSWNDVNYPVVEKNPIPIIPEPFSIMFLHVIEYALDIFMHCLPVVTFYRKF